MKINSRNMHADRRAGNQRNAKTRPHQVENRKRLARFLDHSGESLFIDDRERNVEAAIAMGIRALRFQSVE